MLTNRSVLTIPASNNFTFVPPRMVSQLITAKLNEKHLKQEVQACKANEEKARLELKRVLLEKHG